MGEREREIFGMAEEEGGGGEGGGGRGRGEFAAIIPHPPSITKRENRPLHSALLLPLSLPRCWRNIQSGGWVSSFVSLAPNQLFILRLVISRKGNMNGKYKRVS